MNKSYAIAEIRNIIDKCDDNLQHMTDTEQYHTALAKDMFDDLETVFKLYLKCEEAEAYHQKVELLNMANAEKSAEVETLKAKNIILEQRLENANKIEIPKDITVTHRVETSKSNRNLLTKLAFLIGPAENKSLDKWIEK